MSGSKSILILFFLGLATSKVTRSYCPSNTDSFDQRIRTAMSGHFSSANGEVKKFAKNLKNDKKSGKEVASWATEFQSQVQFVIDGKKQMNNDEVVAYCEGLIGLYNWLNSRCANVQDIKDAVCTNYANKIDNLFGDSAPAKPKKGQKGTQQTVMFKSGSTSDTPKFRGNKYSRNKQQGTKSKKAAVSSPKVEIALPTIETAPIQITQTEIAEIPQDLPLEEARRIAEEQGEEDKAKTQALAQKEEEEEEEQEFLRKSLTGGVLNFVKRIAPEAEKIAEQVQAEEPVVKTDGAVVTTPAAEVKPKKQKRIIVLEVLACKDCKKDEGFQKFFTQSD